MAHFDKRDTLIYITFHCDDRWKMEHLSAPGNALHEAVQQALLHNDVVQVMLKPNTIVVFKDGQVQQGIMFPQPKGKYEDLKYGAVVIGKYEIRKVT